MRTHEELLRRLAPYDNVDHIYNSVGYIAWHCSTGENIEMLFIEAKHGFGASLYAEMVKSLLSSGHPPYHSVFAFVRTCNEIALRFYAKLGFHRVDLGQSIYRDGGTTLVYIVWQDLIDVLRGYGLLVEGADA